jgi:3',5'-cyclic AMP phosphodiesterase CpdA
MTGRILHLTDIHFGCENKAAVQAVLELALRERFAFTAVTGDVTQSGRRIEFDRAAEWIGALPGPVMVTPGNHDVPVPGVIDRILWPFRRYERAFGPAWKISHEQEGLAAHAFNTARGIQMRANWSKGAVRQAQARETVKMLGAAPAGALRVALCHHPLHEVTGGPMTGRVHGGLEAATILAQGGVDVILTGHVHTPFALQLPIADRRTYAVGAPTLSLRERGAPAGFNIVDWDEACIKVVVHGWTGSHFEVQKTWSLDRREPLAGSTGAPIAAPVAPAEGTA